MPLAVAVAADVAVPCSLNVTRNSKYEILENKKQFYTALGSVFHRVIICQKKVRPSHNASLAASSNKQKTRPANHSPWGCEKKEAGNPVA